MSSRVCIYIYIKCMQFYTYIINKIYRIYNKCTFIHKVIIFVVDVINTTRMLFITHQTFLSSSSSCWKTNTEARSFILKVDVAPADTFIALNFFREQLFFITAIGSKGMCIVEIALPLVVRDGLSKIFASVFSA